MSDCYPSPESLQNFQKDVETTAEYANGDNGVPNVNRDGEDVGNLQTLNARALEIAAGAANLQTYLTKAAMDADTSQPAGTVGQVTNDPNPANNGYYVWNGSAWTLSGIQPVQAADLTRVEIEALAAYSSDSSYDYPYQTVGHKEPEVAVIGRDSYVIRGIDENGEDVPAFSSSGQEGVGPAYFTVGRAATELTMIWNFSPTQIARLVFSPNGFNGLFNFKSFSLAAAGPLDALDIAWSTIQNVTTDIFPPVIFEAVNGTAGVDPIYTGGNHGSNGDASGSPTARSVSIEISIAGRRVYPVDGDFTGFAQDAKVRWVNELFAFNTITLGRYAARQTVEAVFAPGGLNCVFRFEALEDLSVRQDNGLQLVQSGYSTIHYFDGQDQARTTIAASASSGVKTTYPAWAMVLAGPSGLMAAWYDRQYAAGTGTYVRGSAGYFRNGGNGKSYSNIVGGGGAPYPAFSAGGGYDWHGGLAWGPFNPSGVVDCAFRADRRSKPSLALAILGTGDGTVTVPAEFRQHTITGVGFAGINPVPVVGTGYATSLNTVEN